MLDFKDEIPFNIEELKNKIDCCEAKFDFWKTIGKKTPLYSIDNDFSFFSKEQGSWNLKSLDTELDFLLNSSGLKVLGIHKPYIYFGQPYSAFAMVSLKLFMKIIIFLII